MVVRRRHCRHVRSRNGGRECHAHIDDDPAGRLSGGACLAAGLPRRLARGILDRSHEWTPAGSGPDRAVPSCGRRPRDARAHWRGGTRLGVGPHVLVIRAWAIGVPAVLAWLLFVTPDAEENPATYRGFWESVGRDFPVLTGAASTDYYFRNETRLLSEQLPPLAGCRLLKSDLWDEAKNTQILQWAAGRGARSLASMCHRRSSSKRVRRWTDPAGGQRCGCPLAAVRGRQLRRDLLDGYDRAFCGVGGGARRDDPCPATGRPHRARRAEPVRPFGRPLLVAALSRLGLYAYGFENR